MKIFTLTLSQILMMFMFIITGFVLNKIKLLPKNADTTLSKLQINVFFPAQLIFTMMTKCTVQTFRENSVLLLYGCILSVVAIAIAYPLARILSGNTRGDENKTYQKNLLVYALTFGNFGFFGNFLVYELWGFDMLFKYSMFTLPFNLAGYTWGLCIITPKSNGKMSFKDILKGVINPPVVGLILGTLMGLTGLYKYVPSFVNTALENASNCMGPTAMLIAGFVIGNFSTKELILIKKTYIISLFRLIIIPSVMLLVFAALGVSSEILSFILIAFAAPVVLVVVFYPAMFGMDNKQTASMVLVSSVLAVLTLPLMFLIFIR